MEDELVILALRSALQARQPAGGLIAHCDRGGQYISNEINELETLCGPPLRAHQAQHEPGRATVADDPYDKAHAESLWSRLKAELLEGGVFLDVEDARTEVFGYIEGYYNRTVRRCGAKALVAGLSQPGTV